MTSGQKTAASLLSTVLIFAAFTVIAFTGIFPIIEARYYEPAKIRGIRTQLDGIAATYDTYINSRLVRFGTGTDAYIKDPSVATYVEQKPSDDNVRTRSKLTGTLFESTPGLIGIRLIDKNGLDIHYTYFKKDIFRQTDQLVSYKKYTDCTIIDATGLTDEKELPYSDVAASENGPAYRIIFDSGHSRIIFSFPFYDAYSVYRGTMLFYTDAGDFNRRLLAENRIGINGTGTLISGTVPPKSVSSPGTVLQGFVFGLPVVGRKILEESILADWQSNPAGPDKLVYTQTGTDSVRGSQTDGSSSDSGLHSHGYWILVSSIKSGYGFISGVYRDEIFLLPQGVQVMLLVCAFMTFFLIVFLLFNSRHDDSVVIRSRIRKFQLAFVSEYFANRETVDWQKIAGSIAGRKQDVSNDIKKSLGRIGRRNEMLVDELLDKSWEEILNALNVRSDGKLSAAENKTALQDTSEIRQMLEDILSKGTIKIQQSAIPAADREKTAGTEPVKDLEEVGEAEPVEDVEEIGEAEPVEDVEEIGEAEPVENLEEVGEAEPVEDLEEVGEAEPVEDLEEVGEAEPVEDLEEVGEAEPVEDLEEVGEAEPVAASGSDYEPVALDEFDAKKTPEFSSSETVSSAETEDFNVSEAEVDEFFTEVMEFGEPEPQHEKSSGNDQMLTDFNVAVPDFSSLDVQKSDDLASHPLSPEPVSSVARGLLAAAESVVETESLPAETDKTVQPLENSTDIKNETDAEPVEELNEPGSSGEIPFSFADFAANNNGVTDLKTDNTKIITEDKDGLYFISNTVSTDTVRKDSDFKNLVESVLKHR
ncbi:MAG: hypothetical protein LKF96_02545 [Treponema sp.]|nr:hypothetical protein [Treponema sp.]